MPCELARARHGTDVTLGLLAAAGDCGFSTGAWTEGARLLLDAFERDWVSSAGAVDVRLEEAFRGATATFGEEAPLLTGDDPTDPPYATLLAAAAHETWVDVAWVGGARALVVRQGGRWEQTQPHTHRELAVAGSPLEGLLSRAIVAGQEPAIEHARFDLRAGDTILLVSHTSQGPESITALVGPSSGAQAAADAVASGLIAVPRQPPFAAVVAIVCR